MAEEELELFSGEEEEEVQELYEGVPPEEIESENAARTERVRLLERVHKRLVIFGLFICAIAFISFLLIAFIFTFSLTISPSSSSSNYTSVLTTIRIYSSYFEHSSTESSDEIISSYYYDDELDDTLDLIGLASFSLSGDLFLNRDSMITDMMDTLMDSLDCVYEECSTWNSDETIVQNNIDVLSCHSNYDFEILVDVSDILSGVFEYSLIATSSTDNIEDAINIPLEVSNSYEDDVVESISFDSSCTNNYIRTTKINSLSSVNVESCSDVKSYFPDLIGSANSQSLPTRNSTYWYRYSSDISINWNEKEYLCNSLFQISYIDYQSAASGFISEPIDVIWSFSIFSNDSETRFFNTITPLLDEIENTMSEYDITPYCSQ